MDKPAAHHRRQRQRNKTGHQHRDDNGHGKFMQQASEQSAHEQNRDENRRERERHGNDREADFLRAFERGFHRRLAVFHVAHDVFEHDDGVVHDEADAQRQRHERKIVEAVTQQRHHGERADDGHRQREAWNERRRKIPQKKKNDHDDEAHGHEQRVFHVRHGFADDQRTVNEHVQMHRRRNCVAELRQQFFDVVHHFHRVRARLALDGQHDGARVVIPGRLLVVLHAVEHVAQLLQPHRIAVAIRDNHRTKRRRVFKLAVGLDGERLMFSVKNAKRLVHVALLDRLFDLVNAQSVSRELVRVHLDAHGVWLRAKNADLRDAVDHVKSAPPANSRRNCPRPKAAVSATTSQEK